MTYNSSMFEAGRGSIYKSPPKSKPKSNANKQAAGSMASAGIGGIGGRPTTSAAKKIQDQFRRETQRDDDRRGIGSKPKVTPTPQKSFLESLYDRVRSSITFAGGDPDRKKRPTPNPGALYTASPFIIPAATAVTASVLGPAVDYTDPTQVPTEMPRIYTPASRDFGKNIGTMPAADKPASAKFDVTDLLGLKEKVARGDAPGLMASPSMVKPAAPATARSAAMTAGINKILKDVIAPESKEYKIKGGDTLSAISRREGVSVEDLVEINGIEDKDKIYTGDSIIIPKPEEVEQAKEFVLRVSTRGDEDPDAQFYQSGVPMDQRTFPAETVDEGLMSRRPKLRPEASDSSNQKVFDKIMKGESTDFNDISNTSKIKPPKPITEMTVAEVREWQDKSVEAGSKSSSVGRYQIIRDTMDDLIAKGAIDEDDVFNEETQNKAFQSLLDRRRYSESARKL